MFFFSTVYGFFSSDDGNFFIWERPTNMISEVFQADKAIVNCVQPHPYCCLLATSGIDHEIRLWSPQPVKKLFFLFEFFLKILELHNFRKAKNHIRLSTLMLRSMKTNSGCNPIPLKWQMDLFAVQANF
jgi:WD40 repeat protein